MKNNGNKGNNVVPLPDEGEIGAQASEWVVLFSDGDTNELEIAAFKRWHAKSEKHRAAFRARSQLWGELDLMALLNDYAESDAVAELQRVDRKLLSRLPLRRRSFFGGIAASLVVVFGASLAFEAYKLPVKQAELRYQTSVGEQREILLADGSKVYLNTDSELIVRYSDKVRLNQLLKGEAHFDVEHDPKRVFSVVAGKNTITAIGTAFSVRRLGDGDKVDVKVSHGRVAVFDTPMPISDSRVTLREHAPMAELAAGAVALLEGGIERVETVTPKELSRKLAWRDGLLAFAGEPLSDVVSQVTRYTNISIDIESESFRDLPISGYAKIGDYEEMVEALEIMTGLRAVRVSNNRVRLVEVSE